MSDRQDSQGQVNVASRWAELAPERAAAARSRAVERSRGRLVIVAALMIVGFGAATVKLAQKSIRGAIPAEMIAELQGRAPATAEISEKTAEAPKDRPDILDRRGELLARDIVGYDISVHPFRLEDPAAAAETIGFVLTDIDAAELGRDFKRRPNFAYIKRAATPLDADKVHGLGLPDITYEKMLTRAYPKGALFSHVLGFVNIDHKGMEGLEFALDRSHPQAETHTGQEPAPIRLSLDTRVQYAVRDEMIAGVEHYGASSGIAIVLDVNNGEIWSLVSVPDYDPNQYQTAGAEARRNRAVNSVYALGSVMKPFTFALGLDRGDFALDDVFDARKPLRIGGRTIRDFHAQNRILTAVEVFTHSSNIGTARMIAKTGPTAQREFFGKVGLLTRVPLEIPSAEPLVQSRWNAVEAATISYGHGISLTPLHVAVSSAALVNGGFYVEPTLFRRGDDEIPQKRRVIKPETSQKIRFLMRANVLDGSGRSADVEGLNVGGKTGTANKQINGRFVLDKRVSSFLAVVPAEAPKFLVLVVLDEPTRVPENALLTPTGGATAAPIAGRIISRISPIMGVWPKPQAAEAVPHQAISYRRNN